MQNGMNDLEGGMSAEELETLMAKYFPPWEQQERERRACRLAAVEAYGPGHTCKACKSPFHSLQKRDSLCQSCRRIIDHWIAKLENEIECRQTTLEETKEFVFADLACRDCAHHRWSGRKGDVQKMDELRAKLPKWVELAHLHFMRHVFFNRFPYSKQFFPRYKDPKVAEETYKLYFCPKERRKRERWKQYSVRF